MGINETTLRDWYLVTFHDMPAPNRVLWGTVEDDPSCRWLPGDWCCTSAVLDEPDDNTFVTKNTRYTTVGSGQRVQLPVSALIALRQGVAPDQWRALRDVNRPSFRGEIEPGDRDR